MNKAKLYLIAIDDNEPLEKRYDAARKLQEMNLYNADPEKVKELTPFYMASEIAEIMNVNYQVINGIIGKYGKKKWLGRSG